MSRVGPERGQVGQWEGGLSTHLMKNGPACALVLAKASFSFSASDVRTLAFAIVGLKASRE